jgi:glutamate/tyrosine decarboxylase-like PLP-dependent enzyme
LAEDHPELEAITHHLSITTLRYVPQELRAELGYELTEEYLNELNRRLLEAIEKSGKAFISNAVIAGKYALRFCIVNFRASAGDIDAMPELVAHLGRRVHDELRSSTERSKSGPREGQQLFNAKENELAAKRLAERSELTDHDPASSCQKPAPELS